MPNESEKNQEKCLTQAEVSQLLQERIAHVLFVAQYLGYRACVPAGITCAGEYSVTLQTGGDFIGAVTVKVFTVNSPYNLCLFRVDH